MAKKEKCLGVIEMETQRQSELMKVENILELLWRWSSEQDPKSLHQL